MRNVQIRVENGTPQLYIDGVCTLPVLYGLSDIPGSKSNTAQAQRNIRNFADAGIHLVTADTGLHIGWHKVSPFDIEPVKEEIASVLNADPTAGVLLRLHMNPPYWWLRDHPEETMVYRMPDGTDRFGTDDGESDRLIRDDANQMMRVSLASEKWLTEVSEKLHLLCTQLRGTREGDALIGIQFTCGLFGEWHQWGTDVSVPMQNHFRNYLRKKYGTNDALRKAWHNPEVTFATAVFRPETWRTGDDGCFRDPFYAQDTIDAQNSIQQTPPEAILRFCKIVKKELPGVLCGSFYGYYIGTGGDNMPISGHLKVEMLYQAQGLIDFLCGPFPYMANRKPDGIPIQRGLLESCRLRNLLWLTEMDQHPFGTEAFVGGDSELFDQTVAQLRKNVFQPLLAGMGLWFYDHRIIPSLIMPGSKNSTAGSIYRKTGWWDTPALMQEICAIREIAQKQLDHPYKPAADVLVVYQPESHYCRCRMMDREYELLSAIAHTGAAYDCIYLDELQ